MRTFILLLLVLSTASAGLEAHADSKPQDENTSTGMRVQTCNTDTIKDPARVDQNASRELCEPLPVALDLRFMDDDYDSPTYDLPVALDLDWDSGEP